MRLKIISDGYCSNTQVVDYATGEIVEGVSEIEWGIHGADLATAKITFVRMAAEFTVDVGDGKALIKSKFRNTSLPKGDSIIHASHVRLAANVIKRWCSDQHNCNDCPFTANCVMGRIPKGWE